VTAVEQRKSDIKEENHTIALAEVSFPSFFQLLLLRTKKSRSAVAAKDLALDIGLFVKTVSSAVGQ